MSEARDYALSQQELERIFNDQIRHDLFDGVHPQVRPTSILIGGQPASGKSRAIDELQAKHGGNDIVPILGDDLRAAHPGYEQMMATDPLSMPARTAQASGAWVEMALQAARDSKISVIVEGTFRRPEVTLGTAEAFATAGYDTHLVALAVPGVLSRLSAMNRYVAADMKGEAARWSDLAAHEAGYHGAALTLSEAARSPHVARVTVVARDGETLFDAARPAPLDRAVLALDEGRRRLLTVDAARTWLMQYETGHEHLRATGQINQTTQPLLEQLAADALTVRDGLTLAEARERASQSFAHEPSAATRAAASLPRGGSRSPAPERPGIDLSR